MQNAAKKALVGVTILAALAIAAFAVPGLVRTRGTSDVSIAAAQPTPIATTAPILLAEPTEPPVVPTPLPTATPAPVAPAVLPTATAAPTPTAPPEPEVAVEPLAEPEDATEPDLAEPAANASEPQAETAASQELQVAPTEVPAPTATATPTAAPTPSPTAEPTPTATPVPEPTATPTVAAEPTATPTPTPTVETGQSSSNGREAADDTTPDGDQTQLDLSGGWMYVDSVTGLNLRASPAGEFLSALEHRSQVRATGRITIVEDRTWAEIDVPSNGWVALEFLNANEPADPRDELPPSSGEAPTADDWAKLRNCESSGNYAIVSSNGLYHGAYQFLPSTWDGIASRFRPDLYGVVPSQAAPADQDAMAFKLYELQGDSPWPQCGRFLR